MDRRVTPPNRVTSPTWDPPPPCKQAAKGVNGGSRSCKQAVGRGSRNRLHVFTCLLFICSDVSGELQSSRKFQVLDFWSHPKLLATLMDPFDSSRGWRSRTFIRMILGDVLSLYQNFYGTVFNSNRNILVIKYETQPV